MTGAETIMIVDDTPENLRLLEQMLGSEGYRVLAFPGGRMALAAAQRQPPDLVLLDVNMPDMDGFEVCRCLKAQPSTGGIPILFLSAATDLHHKVQAFEVGGEDYITKPFQVEEVRARIATHLRLHRLQEELAARNLALQELEAHRDLLVHMVIHDMRSVLQALSGGLEVLEMVEGARLSERGALALGRLKEASTRLQDMSRDVLDVSRIEGGGLGLHREDTLLASLLQGALDRMAFLKGHRTLELALADPGLRASLDPGLMQRVLQNLLGNALKFSPDAGGVVQLRAGSCAGDLCLEVCDNGPGIAPEHRDKVFEKFWQAEEGRRQPRHSTGLGLTFCRMVVEAHGGRIRADSEEGWPCVMRITLPG